MCVRVHCRCTVYVYSVNIRDVTIWCLVTVLSLRHPAAQVQSHFESILFVDTYMYGTKLDPCISPLHIK